MYWLFRPVDIAPLVFFRIFAGVFIAIEVINQLVMGDYRNYIDGEYHFSYQFFPWIKPFPEPGMYALFAVIIFSGILVSIGLFYRWASIALFFSYTLLFLMEKTEYVNHFYLYCLLTFWIMLLPAHRAFSVDVRRHPSRATGTVPAWTLYILLFQIGVVYFYGGIAKLHEDWLRVIPAAAFMSARGHYPVIGPLLQADGFHYFVAYMAIVFDLGITFAMLWRRTRNYAFVLAICFHSFNTMIFGLATFPWFSLMLTALFFPAAVFRKLPVLRKHIPPFDPKALEIPGKAAMRATTWAIGVYAVVQLALPWRHFLYPGNVNWTEEGHNFSWHMMLRYKTRTLYYIVREPVSGAKHYEFPQHRLTDDQVSKMGGRPEMILEYAHFLHALYKTEGKGDVKVYAMSQVGLNGRPRQKFIDPNVDLAKEKRSLKHYRWILPLQTD